MGWKISSFCTFFYPRRFGEVIVVRTSWKFAQWSIIILNFTNDFWEILSQVDFFELLTEGVGCRKNLKSRGKNLKFAGNLDLYTFITAKVPEICAHVSSESWTSKNMQNLNLVDKIRMVIVKLLCDKFSNGDQLDKCLFGVDKGILDLEHRLFAIRRYF